MATKKPERNIVVGLDIGTSKIMALVAEITPDNQIDVIGMGTHPSTGLKRGVVVNIEATVQAVQRAVQEAELMANCQIRQVVTGIAGSHIQSMNSDGIIAIENQVVSKRDIERVIDTAKAVAIPHDQRVLHVIPQYYNVDFQKDIQDPLGMAGVRLEARVHMVTGSVSAVQNIHTCVKRCGLEVTDIILEQLASSQSVLSAGEKQSGVCLIDIGGGTTDIAIFADGAIQHTAVIPIAGDHVTADIETALQIVREEAEAIKLQYGLATLEGVSSSENLHISTKRKVSPRDLAEIIHARYEELFQLIQQEIHGSGFADKLAAGIVFTGGAAKVHGAMDLAQRVFDLPVRLGTPTQTTGLPEVVNNPAFATGVGLLLHGIEQSQQRRLPPMMSLAGASVRGVWTRMREWFQGNF